MKKLSIVIPCYNKWNFTKSCLEDLNKLSNDHEIIIIDNASSDETQKQMVELERSLKMKDKLLYFRNEENTFHSKACNQGFAASSGENVLFFNNDIRVKNNHDNWTQSIIEACGTGNIVGPTMGMLDNKLNFIKEANEDLPGNSYISGWCIAASRETWLKLSGGTNEVWNERFPFYFNDTDLSFRARQKEIPLKVVSIPNVVHFGKISAAQINIQRLYIEGRKTFLENWENK